METLIKEESLNNDLNIKIIQYNEGFQKSEVLRIFYEAFEQKITAFIKSKKKAISIYEKSLNTDRIILAVEDKKITGMAGLHYDDKNFTDINYDTLKRYYSPLKSFFMYWGLRLMTPKVQKETVRIDSIAVDKSCRGRGIGTKLIEAVIEFARQNSYGQVLLEVVDTNPKAKVLYERMGFKVKKKVNFYFLTRSAGFSSEYIMVYDIPVNSK